MRHIVETGTDIAIIGFFDAATLPKNYAAQAKADQMGLFARLSQAGCLWYVETGSDGAYLFHFYVEEPLPELVRKYSEEPKTIPRFQVPSGELWACGAEYISPDPRVGRNFGPEGGLGKYPHMGGSFRIPAGEYEVTVWRTEWPDELIEDKIKERIGAGPWRKQEALGQTTGALFFLLLIGTFVSVGFALSKATLSQFGLGTSWCWGVLVLLWAVCIALMRTLKKMETHIPRKEVERDYPNIAVVIKQLLPA